MQSSTSHARLARASQERAGRPRGRPADGGSRGRGRERVRVRYAGGGEHAVHRSLSPHRGFGTDSPAHLPIGARRRNYAGRAEVDHPLPLGEGWGEGTAFARRIVSLAQSQEFGDFSVRLTGSLALTPRPFSRKGEGLPIEGSCARITNGHFIPPLIRLAPMPHLPRAFRARPSRQSPTRSAARWSLTLPQPLTLADLRRPAVSRQTPASFHGGAHRLVSDVSPVTWLSENRRSYCGRRGSTTCHEWSRTCKLSSGSLSPTHTHMKQLPPSERLAVLVSNVTQTMLGISFAPSLGDQAHPDPCWRTAVMLVDGARPLTVGLSSSQQGCLALTAALFSCPTSAVDAAMINDALCELVNMTAGLLKMEMALDQALSVPQVVTDASVLTSLAALHPALVLKAKEIDLALWAYQGRVITKPTVAA